MVDKRIYLSTNYIFGTFFGRNWENSPYLSSTETEIERFGEFQKLRFFLCIGGTLFRWTHGVLRVLILEWVSISAMVKMFKKSNLYSKEGLKMQDMHQQKCKTMWLPTKDNFQVHQNGDVWHFFPAETRTITMSKTYPSQEVGHMSRLCGAL